MSPSASPILRPAYSRAERLSDAVVHVIGLVLVLVSVPVLITLAAMLRGDGAAIAGTVIYGVTFLAMILCSALYNMIPSKAWGALLQRLDHSAIYWKIAGTYTPFTLLSGQGAWLLGGLWTAALAGTGLKVIVGDRYRWAALSLYLAMGWAGVVAGWPLFATFSGPVLTLVALGGLLYTGGVAFYLWERLPFHNTIWHVFVLVASLLFFAAVTTHLVVTSDLAGAVTAR
ncbi:Hly-III family protein [Aquicoccus sp. SCR17]|nr:Hly-III family protein [Carideicomes alvinocaridis]